MASSGKSLLKKWRSAKTICTRLICSSLLALAALSGKEASAQVNVVTQHNDNARTGANLSETKLNTSNVNAARFGKLFERPADSRIWSQPLVVSNVSIPNKGTRNVVYFQTEVGQIYAYDAENASETAPFWRKDLALNDYQDSLSTPVIDVAKQTLYCVVRHGFFVGNDDDASNDNIWFTFHGLDLRTGANKFNPVTVSGSVASNGGKGAVNGRLNFRPNTQKQRPALLNLNGVIYAAFGGGIYEYEDSATWNGWVFGFDSTTGAIKMVWAVAPDRNGGGIWQAANGIASDGTNIYVTTGNGGNNPLATSTQNGGRDYGNSVVKLTPNSAKTALTVSSFWTPYNFQYMEDADQDLGASGPLLIPGTNLLMTGDKIGRAYVMNTGSLGGFTQGQNKIVQDLAAWKGHLHGGPVYYNSPTLGPLVYGWPEHDYLKAFKVLGNTGLQAAPIMKSLIQVPPGMPGGNLSISANGSTAGTGILWAHTPLVGDANIAPAIVPGVVRAFDANDLTKELWNSEIVSSRDSSGFYGKFTSPTVANGKVYVSTFYNTNFQGAKLIVYGLLPTVAVPSAPANLTAVAGLAKNNLTWGTVTNATTYTLKRSTTSGGPYTVLASNLRTNSYEDLAVNTTTTYYYVVTAENAGGSSANSNQASAKPIAPISGQVISVNFLGGTRDFANNVGVTTTLGASESAGVVPVTNWNTLTTASGTQTALRANGGATTTAAINWSCAGLYATEVPDTAGNYRMMKGYLSNSNTTDTNVTVSGLPQNFITSGYDVYVYIDGHNPTSTKEANYTIAGVTKKVADSQNRNFEGSFFTPGIANVGNYVVFPNLKTAQFTLLAARAGATDNMPRAPINGIQIVARTTTLSAPTNLTAKAVNNGVWLNWNAVTGASTYRVLRATKSGGPYTTVAENLTVPRWSDPSALNNTTYYYVVNALSASGEISAPSNEASATPSASLVGKVISMDLGGGGTGAMAASETAGVAGVVKGNWNSIFYSSGGLGDLKDSSGTATTMDAVWSNGLVGDTAITNSAGQYRMMRSYLAADLGKVFEVNLYNIPTEFVTNGFDIYIYSDNNNGGARTSKITSISTNRGTAIIQITDPANTNFNGTYVNANYSNGNYGRVMNVTDANVTLRFENVSSTDGWAGGAVNGIQIVSRVASSSSAAKSSVTSQ